MKMGGPDLMEMGGPFGSPHTPSMRITARQSRAVRRIGGVWGEP